jgi:peptide chain release factor 2
LNKKTVKADFWQDSQRASKITQEIQNLQSETSVIEQLELDLKEAEEFLEIISKAEKKEVEKKIKNIEKTLNKLEFEANFSGKYDHSDAFLSIHSGAGGVDAQDWAEMLLRMYLRFFEKRKFKAKIIEQSSGQEAGIKSVTLEVSGPFVYGNLKSEAGVHRLVRLSPFNSDNLRQTSFALVEVLPVIEEMKEVKINPQDVRVDVYRSSGAGGQGVNTTDSAVRITHLSTGIVVTCQNERSQLQNKEEAMKILKAKLHQKYLKEAEKEKNQIRGDFVSAEWGSQIRSYVLHPYKLVKDHRTKQETVGAEKVLDGNLDSFIEAYLKSAKNNV